MPSQVRWVLSCQLAVTAVIAVMAILVTGGETGVTAGLSALAGGCIGFAASFAYAWRALRDASGDARMIARAHQMGEGYKFFVTIILFTLVFTQYKNVAVLPLFVAYVATFVVYWVALLRQR